jgi:hypothetical protein
MHGGFDHYGFHFRPGSSTTWDLWYYAEGSESKKLVSGVAVDRAAAMPAAVSGP